MDERTRGRLDPRGVFVFVLYLSTAAIIFRDPERLIAVFGAAFLAALAMRVDFGLVFGRLRRLWMLILMVALLNGVFNPSGTTWLALGPVTLLTSGGVRLGLAVLLRLATLILGGSMLARYPNRVLVQGMIQMKLPCELAYMVSVGIRFIPLTAQSMRDSLTAIQLRGMDFDALPLKKRLRVYTYLLLPTIASGIHSAQGLATAMELRGFRAYPTRTSWLVLKMNRRDYLFLAGIALLIAATVFFGIRFGGVTWF